VCFKLKNSKMIILFKGIPFEKTALISFRLLVIKKITKLMILCYS